MEIGQNGSISNSNSIHLEWQLKMKIHLSLNSRDLKQARSKTSFDKNELTKLIYQGIENVERRRRIFNLVIQDETFSKDRW